MDVDWRVEEMQQLSAAGARQNKDVNNNEYSYTRDIEATLRLRILYHSYSLCLSYAGSRSTVNTSMSAE